MKQKFNHDPVFVCHKHRGKTRRRREKKTLSLQRNKGVCACVRSVYTCVNAACESGLVCIRLKYYFILADGFISIFSSPPKNSTANKLQCLYTHTHFKSAVNVSEFAFEYETILTFSFVLEIFARNSDKIIEDINHQLMMGILFHKKKKRKQFQSFHFRFGNLSNCDAIDGFENALPTLERTHRFRSLRISYLRTLDASV